MGCIGVFYDEYHLNVCYSWRGIKFAQTINFVLFLFAYLFSRQVRDSINPVPQQVWKLFVYRCRNSLYSVDKAAHEFKPTSEGGVVWVIFLLSFVLQDWVGSNLIWDFDNESVDTVIHSMAERSRLGFEDSLFAAFLRKLLKHVRMVIRDQNFQLLWLKSHHKWRFMPLEQNKCVSLSHQHIGCLVAKRL